MAVRLIRGTNKLLTLPGQPSSNQNSLTKKINELLSDELNNILNEVASHENSYEKSITIPTQTQHRNHENCIASCRRLILVDGLDGLILFFQNRDCYDEYLVSYKEKANIDHLTKVLNRCGFHETLEHTKLNSSFNEQLNAIVIGDLDGLKIINDKFGHQYGDSAIQSAVNGIKMSLRKDDIVARWGGDEFIIVLTNVFSMSHVNKLVKRVSMSVQVCSKKDGFPMNISLGSALWGEDGDNLEELIKIADKRMYKQKSINKLLNI